MSFAVTAPLERSCVRKGAPARSTFGLSAAVLMLSGLSVPFALPCTAADHASRDSVADRVDPTQADARTPDIEQRFAVHGRATYGRQ